MEQYKDTTMGFLKELSVDEKAKNQHKNDDVLEEWITRLNELCREFNKLFSIAPKQFKLTKEKKEDIKKKLKDIDDDIKFHIDFINKYAGINDIDLMEYFRNFKLSESANLAMNVLFSDNEIKFIKKDADVRNI